MGPLTHHRVLQVLKNPAYAGAYVHGRHVTRKTVDAAGNIRTVTAEVPRAQWKVLIKDHHPGYVTWDEYLAVEARLSANWTASGARPVREGSALPGHHPLRQLRRADGGQLPGRRPGQLRVPLPP